eukprot:6175810-Pleurochrysis_carterae.AAC.6
MDRRRTCRKRTLRASLITALLEVRKANTDEKTLHASRRGRQPATLLAYCLRGSAFGGKFGRCSQTRRGRQLLKGVMGKVVQGIPGVRKDVCRRVFMGWCTRVRGTG